jgi:hypothetical protein
MWEEEKLSPCGFDVKEEGVGRRNTQCQQGRRLRSARRRHVEVRVILYATYPTDVILTE